MTILDFYLVRHGHSFGQMAIGDGTHMHRVPIDRRPPGCETGLMEDDWRLTPLGQRQAALLGAHLARTPFDMIFCSPLERVRETAQAVIDRQPGPVPVVIPRDLMEIGDWGEETPAQAYERARRVIEAIREQSPAGARILVAAHAAFNNRLLTVLLGLPALETSFWRFAQDNTGLSRVIFSDDVPTRLYCMNDLSHLTPEVRDETVSGNMKALYGKKEAS